MLTDADVLKLAAELNHLLWTDDPPTITDDVAKALSDAPEMEMSRVNMECAAHMVVCSGLFLRRGVSVTTRRGSALVVFPEQARHEKPHFVVKHWWLSTTDGLCDFSLNLSGLSAHKPVIFANRNVADPQWKIAFKDDFRRILQDAEKCHARSEFGVFYQTDNKKSVTLREFESDFLKKFPAAEKRNVPLRFIDIIEHCERLLNGGASLRDTPQSEAWAVLAPRSGL